TVLTSEDGNLDSLEEKFRFEFPRLEEGRVSFSVRARDSRGFVGQATKVIVVDFTAPLPLEIISPLAQTVFSDADDIDTAAAGVQVALLGKAEAGSVVRATISKRVFRAVTKSDGTLAVVVDLALHGPNEVVLRAIDAAGNMSEQVTTAVIYNNPPKLTFLSPRPERGLNHRAVVKWEVGDIDGDTVSGVTLSYRKGEGDFILLAGNTKAVSFLWDVSALSEARDYELKLAATDGISRIELLQDVVIDNTSPFLHAEELPEKAFRTSFTLRTQGSAEDNFSGIEFVEYSIDGNQWFKATIVSGFLEREATFRITHPFALKDGTYQFGVRAVDAAGNESRPVFQQFIIDTTPPRVGSYTLAQGPMVLLPEGDRFEVLEQSPLSLTISLERDTQEAVLSYGDHTLPLEKNRSTGLWEGQVTFAQIGEVSIHLSARDALGNEAKEKLLGQTIVKRRGRVSSLDRQPIEGVKITVLAYQPESQKFVFWQAESYGRQNPIVTDASGEYELLLPEGRWQLVVQKPGFERLRTTELEFTQPRFITIELALKQRQGIRGWFEDVIEKLSF
ncbi:MAG: Ig-like domain-containing protein, partial [Patescibacteria group bacterium]